MVRRYAPKPVRLLSVIAVVAALSTGLATASVATAEPRPSAAELQKQLEKLNTEAERLTEQYNKTRVELKRARAAEKQATATATGLATQAESARAALARLSAETYMYGAGADPTIAVLSGGDPSDLTGPAYLAQNQSAEIQRLESQITAAARARQDAASKAGAAERLAARRADQKKAAEKKIGQLESRLSRMSGSFDPGLGRVTVYGNSLGAKAARAALGKLGSPYVWAAAGPDSFDCSGLAVWAFAQAGRPGLPHYTTDLYNAGTPVAKDALQPGDLVFFHSDMHHMGIYIGGGKFVHAPQTGDVVKITPLSDRSDFTAAARIS